MPIFVLLIGIVLIVSAWRGTQEKLRELLVGDFTGQNSYLMWVGALLIVYLVSKVEPSGKVGKGLVVLVILTLVLRSGSGFFDQLSSQLKQIQTQPIRQTT